MASKHFLAKILATVIVVCLLVSDTSPAAASGLLPYGREKRLAVPSVGIGGRVGWRKMNARRVMMESVRGEGLSIRRSLRRFPLPPPAPVHSPSIIYGPPPRPRPRPRPPPPPPSKQ